MREAGQIIGAVIRLLLWTAHIVLLFLIYKKL